MKLQYPKCNCVIHFIGSKLWRLKLKQEQFGVKHGMAKSEGEKNDATSVFVIQHLHLYCSCHGRMVTSFRENWSRVLSALDI